jgi:DNA-binding PadR family transcriptional regulator
MALIVSTERLGIPAEESGWLERRGFQQKKLVYQNQRDQPSATCHLQESVYPHLQMVEDEGLVQSSEVDGSRAFTLTETGRSEAEKATLPWEEAGESDDEVRTLRLGVGQLMSSAKQLAGAGEIAQIERGITVIQKARKELYQILAED